MRAALTLAMVLGALALDRLALSTSPGADLLVPTPERTAQAFVTSVATRRPEQGRQRLTADARAQWSAAHLRELDRAWRQRDGDYRMVDGDESRRDGRSELRAQMRTTHRGTVQRLFVLEREAETALWRISQLEAD